MPSQNYTEEDIQNGIPANAKVKSIEDSNVSYQTNPVSKTQELINKYFNTKEEAPVLDQAKIDRLQKMGRINTLSRGLNVLGDGLSLALGANVKRKAPDTTAPALYQSYENTIDQHTKEVKGYKQRDFQKKLSDIQFGISRLDKETDQDYRERVQKANEEFRKVKNAQDLAKWQLEYGLKKEKNDSDIEKNKITGKAAMIRANKTGTKASDKEEKPFMVAGLNGRDIPLTQGEFRDLLAEATQAANKAGTNSPQFKDFQATMESFKDNPLEGQKNIVQRYYGWKKEQESLTKNRELKGLDTQPVQQAAPKAQFNPDKAKKFKGVVPQGGF